MRKASHRPLTSQQLDAMIAEMPLSKVLRLATLPDHDRAEHSTTALLEEGTIDRPTYVAILRQLYLVYRELERRGDGLVGDPIVAPFLDAALRRAGAVLSDILALGGSRPTDTDALTATERYLEAIWCADSTQFLAHHYTRYLADLSGGQLIGRALARAWDLTDDGVAYYRFETIPDPSAYKRAYRSKLDRLDLDPYATRKLIEEALRAYELNVDLLIASAASAEPVER